MEAFCVITKIVCCVLGDCQQQEKTLFGPHQIVLVIYNSFKLHLQSVTAVSVIFLFFSLLKGSKL